MIIFGPDIHGLLLAAMVCVTGFGAGTNLANGGGYLARSVVVGLLVVAGLALWNLNRQTYGLVDTHLAVPLAFIVVPSCTGLLLSFPWTVWRDRRRS